MYSFFFSRCATATSLPPFPLVCPSFCPRKKENKFFPEKFLHRNEREKLAPSQIHIFYVRRINIFSVVNEREITRQADRRHIDFTREKSASSVLFCNFFHSSDKREEVCVFFKKWIQIQSLYIAFVSFPLTHNFRLWRKRVLFVVHEVQLWTIVFIPEKILETVVTMAVCCFMSRKCECE